jgi:hypothetical protein
VLAVAIFARYRRQMAGAWRKAYVIPAMIALYLNVFVLVAQLVATAVFIILTIVAVKRFRISPV